MVVPWLSHLRVVAIVVHEERKMVSDLIDAIILLGLGGVSVMSVLWTIKKTAVDIGTELDKRRDQAKNKGGKGGRREQH